MASRDAAYMAGLEHAVIGDCIVLMDLAEDPMETIPDLCNFIMDGGDIATSRANAPRGSIAYHACSAVYRSSVRLFGGKDPREEVTRFRAISKRVVAHILRHDASVIGQGAMPGLEGIQGEGYPATWRTYREPAPENTRGRVPDGYRSADQFLNHPTPSGDHRLLCWRPSIRPAERVGGGHLCDQG